MANAVRVHTPGGPEVLQYENYEPGNPGSGEVRLEQHAVGLNFIDVYHRTGLYPIADKPFVLGLEAAGVVAEIGDDVSGLSVGDRVAYAAVPIGAYCDERIIPAHRLVKLPDELSFETGAAMMLQGMTVQYLIRSTYRVQAGDTVLFHAAAGGVGAIACQWLNHLGATVIGTVLSPMGMFISFGSASGPVENVSPATLAAKGSLFFTRPTLMTYTADANDLQTSAKDLFDAVTSGAVNISIDQTYALKDARQAHEDLESRKTTGSTVFSL